MVCHQGQSRRSRRLQCSLITRRLSCLRTARVFTRPGSREGDFDACRMAMTDTCLSSRQLFLYVCPEPVSANARFFVYNGVTRLEKTLFCSFRTDDYVIILSDAGDRVGHGDMRRGLQAAALLAHITGAERDGAVAEGGGAARTDERDVEEGEDASLASLDDVLAESGEVSGTGGAGVDDCCSAVPQTLLVEVKACSSRCASQLASQPASEQPVG